MDRTVRMVSGWPGSTRAACALVAVALFYCYHEVAVTLVWQWASNDAYSYGVLIPPIAGYMAWRRRGRLAGDLVPARAAGTVVLTVGLATLAFGRRAGVVDIQEVSLLPTLMGLTLLFGGPAALRAMWLPIAYLSLMMPIWGVATERLHGPSQVLAAILAEQLLHLANVPVHRSGTFLVLPAVTLEVARLCSGVNYLIGVLALAVPAAYLFFTDALRRSLLLIVSIAIAVLANALRIGLIGILLHYGVTDQVHGPGHLLQGLLVALVGYAGLFGSIILLSRWQRCPGESGGVSLETPAIPWKATRHPGVWGTALISVLLLVVVGSVDVPAADARPILARQLEALPTSLGAWHRVESAPTAIGNAVSATVPSRMYRDGSGRRVEVKLGSVLGSTSEGGHALFVDALAGNAREFSIDVGDTSVAVNRSILTSGARKRPVIYWYDVEGEVLADSGAARILTLQHRLTGRGRLPFVVALTAIAPATVSEEAALAIVTSFARDFFGSRRRVGP